MRIASFPGGECREDRVAGRISDASINAVRERVSIEDIIGSHVALRPAGAGQVERALSLSTTRRPRRSTSIRSIGYFHCFGCGEGGDSIKFVEKVEGLTFPEAIERLARQLNITLDV